MRQIQSLNQGADAVSKGEYGIRIPEHKNEYKDLAEAFNTMASAVECRTTELEDKTKELQVFIDDLSHEMNTPLTSIGGYAEFLQNANATEEQRIMAAGSIRTQAARMKDIYSKLIMLTVARELEPEITRVDLNEFFHDIWDTFYIQLSEQQVTLHIDSQLPSLQMDRTLMHMLVSNLIKNSLQAMKEDGTIILKAYLSDNNPVIEVSDNGFGIPEDKIDIVTKPFFRIDTSRSRKTGGAGLGLTICKSIAKLHNAELYIQSKNGIGTTVLVKFLL